jgi:HTH-type transcriptional regulator / antitoxin HigA
METMSAAASQVEYASLLRRTLPSVVHTEKENERYISVLEALDQKGDKLTVAERRLAELLTVLVEDFEEKTYALKAARPVDVLHELMQSNGLKQKDMLDIFGTPSIISEVLREKRSLTVDHIRKLSRRFQVSPEVFF